MTNVFLRISAPELIMALCVALSAAGCVSLPTADEITRDPSPHLSPDAPVGITDERSRFRVFFCDEFEARKQPDDTSACDSWLHRLPDEMEPVPASSHGRMSLQALFVTGAFGECFGDSALPFANAITALQESGDDFGTIVGGGRSGTEHNAQQIAEFIKGWPVAVDKPLVLFGYSKGTSDILQFLVDFPDLAGRVSAVVSVAGAVGGSPLADRYDSIYDLLFSHLPSSHCEKGDYEVVDSLRTDLRQQWLTDNVLPEHIRYYSLVAFTTRERVATGLVPSWEALLQDSRRNDGQLVPIHAMLPGSSLLGYLNADHWAVAMELETEHGIIAKRHDPVPFPHTALLSSILRTVGEDLLVDKQNAAGVSASAPRHQSAPDPLRR